MQPGSDFSLAAALWGWPPAPGHAASEQLAPDSWLAQFREHHAASDPAVLSGLFTACPAGRDWVLEAASDVHVTLDTTEQQTLAQWQRRVAALSSILSARGDRGLCLRVECEDSTQCAASAYVLPRLLCGLGVAVTELVLEDVTRQHAVYPLAPLTTLLHVLASAFAPHLTTLSLDPCPCALPPPDLLPQLSSLSVSLSGRYMWHLDLLTDIAASVAVYMTQLSRLKVERGCDVRDDHFSWAHFTPATPSNTLTCFSTDMTLNRELFDLVFEDMPALESLCVSASVLRDDASGHQWGVQHLTFSNSYGASCDALRVLPRCREGQRMTLHADKLHFTVDNIGGMGFGPSMVERLQEWEIDCDTVNVWVGHQNRSTATLRHTISQLCEVLQTSGDVTLSLQGWAWDADALREYVAAFPALAERGVVSHSLHSSAPLTDNMLEIALQARSQITSLSVRSLALQSDTHANTPWPWYELTIDTLYIADLCKLPDPSGVEDGVWVECTTLIVHNDTIAQVGYDRVIQRLEHYEWSLSSLYSMVPCIRLMCPSECPAGEFGQALSRQLALLRAMRVKGDQQPESVRVLLDGWPDAFMSAQPPLELPAWAKLNSPQRTVSFVSLEDSSADDLE